MSDRFYEHVIRRAGFRSREEAESAVGAVLDALGDALSPQQASEIAAELPESFRERLVGASHRGITAKEFFEEIARAEHTAAGFAREHAGVVLDAVLAELSPEGKRRLRTSLPTEMSELLESRREARESPTRPEHRERSTLSSGRPGSAHPLSEAAPHRAHDSSVAASSEPHADSKISSAPGTSQELLGDTLAAGKPGSKRPLDEG